MHILCTICSDLVNQAESLYVTKCGHIFHHHCLSQWIERSKSCPQCRNKVTERCMFRMYPTVSNEASAEDSATLQARLDDAMLQLRTQRATQKDLEDQLAAASSSLKKKEQLLQAAEGRLESREAAAAMLKVQLECARAQAAEAAKLKDENQRLAKNIDTLNGLQRVLNATAHEVEDMVRGYSDTRTVATFAAALKRALLESEGKKREWRQRQLAGASELAAAQAHAEELRLKLRQADDTIQDLKRKCAALEHKRKAAADEPRAAKQPRPPASPPYQPSPAGLEDSFCEQGSPFTTSAVSACPAAATQKARGAESPYLQLRVGSVALAAQQRTNLLKSSTSEAASLSIFSRAAPPPPRPPPEASYDGLGGHARPDASPAPRAAPRAAPRLTAKHRLRKFNPHATRDIKSMFEQRKD